jgi:hypothetical protein
MEGRHQINWGLRTLDTDAKTDIFALGSAIYFIITGHEVFPKLDSVEED